MTCFNCRQYTLFIRFFDRLKKKKMKNQSTTYDTSFNISFETTSKSIVLQLGKDVFSERNQKTMWYIAEPDLLRSKVKNVEIGCDSVGLTLTLHLMFTKQEHYKDVWFLGILQVK